MGAVFVFLCFITIRRSFGIAYVDAAMAPNTDIALFRVTRKAFGHAQALAHLTDQRRR